MKFKCKLTGCVYEFTAEHDIKTMKEHPDYTIVVEDAPKPIVAAKKVKPAAQDEDTI